MTALADLLICLRFLSRLPVPATARERALGASGFAAAASMAPVAGLVLALGPAAILALAQAAGLPPTISASLSIAALVMLTGAMHEDGLADCADGFGGGATREGKLAIMRDSRIGAYGAVAIGLALILRVACLGAAAGMGRGVAALITAAVLSRAACLAPLALLPPARPDGAGATARLARARLLAASLLAVALVAVGVLAGFVPLGRGLAAVALAASAGLAMSALARRQIGGQTGDVAGAAQQAAEIAVLLAFAAG